MAILTDKTIKKKERNVRICADYRTLMKGGSQKTAVYEQLQEKYKPISTTQIGRIVGNIKANKKKIVD